MWRSDEQMYDDEVVPDGTGFRERVSFPSHDSSRPYSGSSSQHLLNKSSQLISKNTDSGFLSGVSINEESATDIDYQSESSSKIQEHPSSEMQIKSAPSYSDSGLSLDYSQSDLQSNNLSSPSTSKIQNDSRRRITLHDLLRPDEDGDM